MNACNLNHRRTRHSRRAVCTYAWMSSLVLHGLAVAVAWAVAAPGWHKPSELIGQHTRIELAVTMAPSEIVRPVPAPLVELAVPVRIMPAEAEIARRRFRVESTSVSKPTPFERQWVERLVARPAAERRPVREHDAPTLQPQPSGAVARSAAAEPVQRQPGTADRPLPELIQSPPPEYPQSAIARRWEGTVLLRLGVTAEGHVSRVEVVESSGYDVLDGAAVRAVRAWRFVPALRDGHPVPSFVRLPVRFEYERR